MPVQQVTLQPSLTAYSRNDPERVKGYTRLDAVKGRIEWGAPYASLGAQADCFAPRALLKHILTQQRFTYKIPACRV